MKEYITIRHVGPLADIDRIEIRQFTVLIGESAIGKSTLLKVLILMRYLFKRANIRSFLKQSKITKSPFKIHFDAMVKATRLGSMFNADSYIKYEVEMESGRSYALEYIGNARKRMQLPDIATEDLMFLKESFISENRNVIPSWTANAYSNRNASLGFYFHETMNDFTSAIQDDSEYELGHLGMKLAVRHPKGRPVRLTVEKRDNSHAPIELTEASSGVQTSTPLSVIVQHFARNYSFKDAFRRSVLDYMYDSEMLTKFSPIVELNDMPKYVHIHIEEPELSLFPDAQCRLIDDIVRIGLGDTVKGQQNGIIMATHSPYILNYINVMLHQKNESKARLYPGQVAAYRLCGGQAQNLMAKDDAGRIIVDTYDLSEMMAEIYREFKELTE
jgi:predicted ATPase